MESIPPHVMCRLDKGFRGLEVHNVIGPKKKPKGTALTDEEKNKTAMIPSCFRHPLSGTSISNTPENLTEKLNADGKLITQQVYCISMG